LIPAGEKDSTNLWLLRVPIWGMRARLKRFHQSSACPFISSIQRMKGKKTFLGWSFSDHFPRYSQASFLIKLQLMSAFSFNTMSAFPLNIMK
jgi:hypothetical protein